VGVPLGAGIAYLPVRHPDRWLGGLVGLGLRVGMGADQLGMGAGQLGGVPLAVLLGEPAGQLAESAAAGAGMDRGGSGVGVFGADLGGVLLVPLRVQLTMLVGQAETSATEGEIAGLPVTLAAVGAQPGLPQAPLEPGAAFLAGMLRSRGGTRGSDGHGPAGSSVPGSLPSKLSWVGTGRRCIRIAPGAWLASKAWAPQ
jgi:hypothetical protein